MDSIQFTVAIRPVRHLSLIDLYVSINLMMMSCQQSETWAAFRTRLALRLGRDLKRTKGSGRYQMSGFQYSSQKQFKDGTHHFYYLSFGLIIFLIELIFVCAYSDDIIFDPLGNDQVKAITISEPVQSSYSNGGGIRFT
jgi:hypothetical protein